jgi:sugar-specific transcriptional regulator TrmB
MYRPTKSYIDGRRTTIERQLQELHNELRTYLTQLEQNVRQWQPMIDSDALSNAINECVKKSQQRLKDEFQHRIAMLKLDCNDHQSIAHFYSLKPNEEVVQLAKQIWHSADDELKMKDQLEILRQRIFLERLPPKTDRTVNQLLDDETISLANPFLEKDQRVSFATRCSKTIIQCKFNLMLVQIECHHSKVASFQEQLRILKTRAGLSLPMNSWIDAIEQRRQAMTDRLFRLRQHKWKSFFDQAPTMDNSN